MEERIAKLEAISDSTVAAVAVLRTDMNDRFKLIDTQLTELRRQKADIDRTQSKLEALENQITDLRQYIDHRFSETDRRFEQVERRFQEQGEQIKELRSEFRFVSRWIIGTQITIALFVFGLAAKVLFLP